MKFRQWMFAAAAAGAIAAAAGPAFADVRRGIELWRANDYEGAVREWRPLAEQGDANAQFNLGQAYRLGRGVPLDIRQAQIWFERAARQGHAQAEANLGLTLFQNNEGERALPWLRRAAERGDPRAQYVLGTAHFNGDLVPRDWPRAYALLRRAADQGLPQAASSLSEMERHLTPEDRERGQALAQQMAASAPAPAATAVAAPPPPRVAPQPAPVRTPRIAGAQPPVVRTPVPAPAPPRTSQPPRPAPRAQAPAPRRAAPAPAPRPAAIAGGRWRVQLGAFSSQANAERQWRTVRGRISGLSGLQPFLVRFGNLTRLQAGPLADRGAANRICAAARSAGHDCIVVAP